MQMVLLLTQRFPSEKWQSPPKDIVIIWSWPVSVTREQSALWWRRTSTTSSRPPSAATCKGVQPAKYLLTLETNTQLHLVFTNMEYDDRVLALPHLGAAHLSIDRQHRPVHRCSAVLPPPPPGKNHPRSWFVTSPFSAASISSILHWGQSWDKGLRWGN